MSLREPQSRIRGALRLLAVAALLGSTLSCGEPPTLRITSPANGGFTNAAAVAVAGYAVYMPPTSTVTSFTVNGIPTLLDPFGNWATTVPLDPGAIFNAIVAELHLSDGRTLRDRVTLVVGDGITTGFVIDGDASPDSVAMRFNESGLAQVTPVVESLSAGAFDIGALITAQNPILDDECVVEALGGCLYFATANAVEAGIGNFSLVTDAQTGLTRATIGVEDLYLEIDLHVRDLVALEITCGLEILAADTTITADFAMDPLASDPSKVDVRQVGPPQIQLGGFQSQFISGSCTAPVIGDILQLLVSPSMIQGLVQDGFAVNLADPDGAGPQDGPIAGALETALGGISIAGPIGQAIGVDFRADFSSIAEDADGITFAAGAAITNPAPVPGAPDLPASYTVAEPFPTFGPEAPVGGQPYGLALAISTSAFNQLLKSQVEGGLLQGELTSIDLGGGALVPLTVGLLALFIPELGVYPVLEPVKVVLKPALAPIVTGEPGPGGELAELLLGGLRVEIRLVNGNVLLLGAIVDARIGVDLTLDDGALSFTLGAPAPDAISLTLVDNPRFVNEANVASFLPGVLPLLLPTLASALGSFPLPDFLGLSLAPVEISRAGDFLGLFLDLAVEPSTHLESFVLTDLSTGDYKLDGGFDQNEWRHRVSGKATATSVQANLKGMLGADACCTTGDRSALATAGYRLTFDVVAIPGDTWTLDVSHAIAGAFTLHDEKVLEQDAGGHARFNSPVNGSYRVNGGAPVSFGFSPSPGSATNGVGCTPAILFCSAPSPSSGTRNVAFTGGSSAQITGSGNASIQLDFSFALESFSNSNFAFPAAGGDEIAIRLGKDETLADGYDAGAYPGNGARNPADDGHRVSVQLSTVAAP